jgi:hypothetical protein
VEAYYDQTRSKDNGFGLHYKHLSSNGGIADRGPSDYGTNSIDAYYDAYLGKHVVQGRALYDRRRVSYYGYPSTDSLENLILVSPQPPEDALKQVYNDLGFTVRVKSLYADSTKLAHDAGLDVHNYTNLSGSRELNLKIHADLSTVQGSETYGGQVSVDNNAYLGERGDSLPELRQNGTMVGLTPFVSTTDGKYLVKVGAGIWIDAMGKTTFHFYPQAHLQYRLFDDILVPYLGVDGRRQRNSFRSLTRDNPFMDGAPQLHNSSLMYDLYGGCAAPWARTWASMCASARAAPRTARCSWARSTTGKAYAVATAFWPCMTRWTNWNWAERSATARTSTSTFTADCTSSATGPTCRPRPGTCPASPSTWGAPMISRTNCS